MQKTYKAGEFKTHCLEIITQVHEGNIEVLITKRGEPYVVLKPVKKQKSSSFGKLKGTVEILGDLIAPIDEEWDACR